jgi:hypothetical protein
MAAVSDMLKGSLDIIWTMALESRLLLRGSMMGVVVTHACQCVTLTMFVCESEKGRQRCRVVPFLFGQECIHVSPVHGDGIRF